MPVPALHYVPSLPALRLARLRRGVERTGARGRWGPRVAHGVRGERRAHARTRGSDGLGTRRPLPVLGPDIGASDRPSLSSDTGAQGAATAAVEREEKRW